MTSRGSQTAASAPSTPALVATASLVEDLEHELEAMRSRASSAERRIQELEATLVPAAVGASASSEQTRLVILEQELQEMRAARDDAERTLASLRGEHAAAVAALKTASEAQPCPAMEEDQDDEAGEEDEDTVASPKGDSRSFPATGSGVSPVDASLSLQLHDRRPWLVIGIPTVPRSNSLDYLNPTLDYILQQLPPLSRAADPFFGRVLIVVMNQAHGVPHPAFDAAVERFHGKDTSTRGSGGGNSLLDGGHPHHPKGSYLRFVTNPKPRAETGRTGGDANKPGPVVRQQTLDVIALLDALIEGLNPLPAHYMFMEDDFRLCPHALRTLEYLLDRAYRQDPDWIMVRVCFGLNGGVIQGRDLPVLADYLRDSVARRPPDHLLVEWFAGETPRSAAHKGTRTHFASRYNLLEHFGTVSSLRKQRQSQYAACYEELGDGVLFEVEAFKARECGHDDLWPCKDNPNAAVAAALNDPTRTLFRSAAHAKDAPQHAAIEGVDAHAVDHALQHDASLLGPRPPAIGYAPLQKHIARVDHTHERHK